MLLIDEYKYYLEGVEGKSLGTIEQYYSSVKLFMQHMKDNKFSVTRESVSKIKVSDIYSFLGSLKDMNSNSTRKNKVSALKSFMEFCKNVELVKHNIILDIKKLPKSEKRVPVYFTLEQCKLLLKSIGSRNKVRDNMIIVLFLNTGLRLSELCSLDVSCIEDKTLKIIGKGNKERPVYLNDDIRESLREYLEQRGVTEEKALFLSERGNRISKSAVQNLCKNAIENAGLNVEGKSDVCVHVLRHTAASIMINDGVDIRKIQEIFGHEDISTTQIYTHIAKQKLQDVADNSSLRTIQ
jgi:integrase/recombinase XerD